MRYAETSASERRYLPPAVAVSVVAFALRPPAGAECGDPHASAGDTSIWLPLVRRTRAPFLGQWALPGGPTEWDETLDDTALRTLHDAAGCTPGTLEQLYSFGSVERSAEAQRLVTIAYWALYGEHELEAIGENRESHAGPARRGTQDLGRGDDLGSGTPRPRAPRRWDDPILLEERGADDSRTEPGVASDSEGNGGNGENGANSANVAWFAADRLPELAFDHADIVAYALSRLRVKTEYASVAHRFLGPVFTLSRLRAVTEAVLGQPVDPANFRRQALAQGTLVDTGEVESGGRHRPARLYRFSEPPTSASPPAIPAAPTSPRSRE